MVNQLTKLWRMVRYPHICYLLFSMGQKNPEVKMESSDHDTWHVLVQFYKSNRTRGFSRKESMDRALSGYGCYEGWEIGDKRAFL